MLLDYSPSSPVLESVRTLYAFEGNNPEELPFGEGENLEILGKPVNDPEWWVAKNREGKIGLVPRIYTEVVDHSSKKFSIQILFGSYMLEYESYMIFPINFFEGVVFTKKIPEFFSRLKS